MKGQEAKIEGEMKPPMNAERRRFVNGLDDAGPQAREV
jgi:hypothetical protein